MWSAGADPLSTPSQPVQTAMSHVGTRGDDSCRVPRAARRGSRSQGKDGNGKLPAQCCHKTVALDAHDSLPTPYLIPHPFPSNHEIEPDIDLTVMKPYDTRFRMPRVNGTQSHYYSIDIGPVHVRAEGGGAQPLLYAQAQPSLPAPLPAVHHGLGLRRPIQQGVAAVRLAPRRHQGRRPL